MKKRRLWIGCLVVSAPLWAFTTALAQDLFVTNLDQLVAEAYSGEHCIYFPFIPLPWRAYSLDGGQPWWIDCSQFDCADLLTSPTNLPSGVSVYPIVLTKNLLTGETTLQPDGSTNVVATVAAPSGYEPGVLPEDASAWHWYQQLLDCPDCYGIEGVVPPPTVILEIFLANANDYATYAAYQNNLDAMAEAQAATTASAMSLGSRFMAMDDEDDGGGDGGDGGSDPCSITNLTQPFFVTIITQSVNHATTITWQSCQFFRYLVWEASALSTNTQWLPVAYVWGSNSVGVTSWTDTATTNNDGSTITQRFYRVQRFPETPIAAGGYFSLALTPDGKLWSWGENDDGQLGNGFCGDDVDINDLCPFPSEVANLTTCFGQTINNPVALACGDDFFVVADATGTVWTCGGDDAWKLGWGPYPAQETSPNAFPPSPVPGISNVVSAAGGLNHTLALRGDGTVWAWGSDSDGQLGDGGLVSSNGDCQCTNTPVQSIFPSGTFIVDIAAGAYHSVALDAFGNVWTWGWGAYGQLGNGQNANIGTPAQAAGVSNVMAIAAGYDHTIALTADRTVWTWGDNGSGELGRSGGANSVPGQVPPYYLSNIVAIAAGNGFSLAVSNGYVYAFGQNGYGELGTNTGGGSLTTPTLVSGISNVLLVVAGATGYHSLAMTVAGGTNQYWAWGANYDGQVGNGTNDTISNGTNDYQYVAAQAQFCTRCQRCVQLGTSGILTAQCNGTLYLYFNGQITDFGGYSGSYTVTVNNVTNMAVPATSGANIENGWPGNGVSFGTVTNGGIYPYTAIGYCQYQAYSIVTDANGTNTYTGSLVDCSNLNFINITDAVCPARQCFSLIGKIQ